MGFLLVEYPTDRKVYIDDEPCGTTNTPFEVPNGRHVIDLGSLENYVPSFRRITVQSEPYEAPKTTSFDPA